MIRFLYEFCIRSLVKCRINCIESIIYLNRTLWNLLKKYLMQ